MARDRINQWIALPYFDPTKVLSAALQQGFRHALGGRSRLPSEVQKCHRKRLIEDLDAAAFAHGLRKLFPDREVCIAEFEALDHDFILRFGPEDTAAYCPLQLKVLVSHDVNGAVTAESLLEGIGRTLVDASDLVVAVKVDCVGVNPRNIEIPRLSVGELWFFGQSSDRDGIWYLFGDCLSYPRMFEFTLPRVC